MSVSISNLIINFQFSLKKIQITDSPDIHTSTQKPSTQIHTHTHVGKGKEFFHGKGKCSFISSFVEYFIKKNVWYL